VQAAAAAAQAETSTSNAPAATPWCTMGEFGLSDLNNNNNTSTGYLQQVPVVAAQDGLSSVSAG